MTYIHATAPYLESGGGKVMFERGVRKFQRSPLLAGSAEIYVTEH